MGKDNNLLLLDMDGTICDYVGPMRAELRNMLNPGEVFVDPYNLHKDVGFLPGDKKDKEPINYDWLWARMDNIKANPDFWANLPPLSLGFDVLGVAQELGYTPHILTQIPQDSELTLAGERIAEAALVGKHRWLKKHGVLEQGVRYWMGRGKDMVYGKVLVDDFPGYFLPWLNHRPRGLVIMPADQQNASFEGHPQVICYHGENLDEVRAGLERVMERD